MTGGGFRPLPVFPLIGLQVGARLAIMQGVAWGSRRYLCVTLIWWLHKTERDDGGEAGLGVGGMSPEESS